MRPSAVAIGEVGDDGAVGVDSDDRLGDHPALVGHPDRQRVQHPAVVVAERADPGDPPERGEGN